MKEEEREGEKWVSRDRENRFQGEEKGMESGKWGAGSGRRNKCEGGKAPGKKFRNKATLPRVQSLFRIKISCCVYYRFLSLSSLMRSRDNIIPSARQLLLAN